MTASPPKSRSIVAHLRRAFTLIEMSLSIVIFSIILVAAQSSILLAARGIPDGRGRNSALLSAVRPVDLIGSDLAFATAILSATATDIVFTVPDRNGDGSPETIRYNWSGTVGGSLTRQVNGGTAIAIADNVQEFALVYDKRAATAATTYSQGGEVLLGSYDPGLLALGTTSITSSNSVGQYFKPTIPTSATSWSVTRVQLKAKTNGSATGVSSVQLRPALGSLPSPAVLESVAMSESSLGTSLSTQEFAFTGNTPLDPSKGVCVVVQWVSGSSAGDLQYTLLGSILGSGSSFTGTDSGGWSTSLLSALTFAVYGKITSPNASTFNYFLTDVRCTLRTSADASARLVTTVRIPSEPQVAGP